MQSVAVIVSMKYASSRFPGKPLAKILGKPMMLHVLERCAKAIDRRHLYLATDNNMIADTARGGGFNVMSVNTGQCKNCSDATAIAVKDLTYYDNIVEVQGDEPLVNPDDIKKVIEYKEKYPDMLINPVVRIDTESAKGYNVPKMVFDSDFNLLYASRELIPHNRDGVENVYYRQYCIYGFSRNALLSVYGANKDKSRLEKAEDIHILRAVEAGHRVKCFECFTETQAVDEPGDIEKVERIMKCQSA